MFVEFLFSVCLTLVGHQRTIEIVWFHFKREPSSLSKYSLWSIHRVHILSYQFLVIIIWWLFKWIILKKNTPSKKVTKQQVLIRDPRGLLSNHCTSSLTRSYTSATRCKRIITCVGFNIAYMHQTAVAKPKSWENTSRVSYLLNGWGQIYKKKNGA